MLYEVITHPHARPGRLGGLGGPEGPPGHQGHPGRHAVDLGLDFKTGKTEISVAINDLGFFTMRIV